MEPAKEVGKECLEIREDSEEYKAEKESKFFQKEQKGQKKQCYRKIK